MPVKKDLIYPQFLEACQYTVDVFWEGIFEELAYGRPPYGTYISSNSLCCSYKDRKFSYKIEKKNARELHDEVYQLLSSKLKLLSQRDKIQKRIEFYSESEDTIEVAPTAFSDVRKKSLQDLLVERFVIRMWKDYNLSLVQARRLLGVIYIGRVLKTIRPKDIEIQDGIVIAIDGIMVTEGQVRFVRDLFSQHTSSKNANLVLIEKARIADGWEKLLTTLRKH